MEFDGLSFDPTKIAWQDGCFCRNFWRTSWVADDVRGKELRQGNKKWKIRQKQWGLQNFQNLASHRDVTHSFSSSTRSLMTSRGSRAIFPPKIQKLGENSRPMEETSALIVLTWAKLTEDRGSFCRRVENGMIFARMTPVGLRLSCCVETTSGTYS